MPTKAVYYPRSLIETAEFPINGNLQEMSLVENIVFHYTGAVEVPDYTHEKEVALLKAINKDYWTNRKPGYSIGYNWAVFESGRIYELRGFKYRCAANGKVETNRNATAILVVTGSTETPTAKQLQSIRNLVSDLYVVYGKTLKHLGHREVKATGCPGNIQFKMIKNGDYEPLPPVVEEKGQNEVLLVFKENTDRYTVFFWNGVELKWVSSGRSYALLVKHFPVEPVDDDQVLYDIIKDSKCVGDAPYTLSAEQKVMWK